MNLAPEDKEKKLLMKILVIVIIIIVILAIVGGFIIIKGLSKLIYNPATVSFVEYKAQYNFTHWYDLDSIESELENNSITVITSQLGSSPYYYIECNIGEGFNNLSFNDTRCYIYDHAALVTYDVSLRLFDEYDGQVISRNIEEMETDLQISMDYITGIIYNATGYMPINYEFIYEDGSSLPYPG